MADDFHRLMATLDYPMVIVTARADLGAGPAPSGCLVGFSSQCSLQPPRYAVWISRENHTHAVAWTARHLAVHFPGPGQIDLARLFGEETGDQVDKFARCAWESGPADVPLLRDCPNWMVGLIHRRIPTGDHSAFVLEPVASSFRPDPALADAGGAGAAFRALGFQSVKDLEPGHPA